MTYYTTEQYKEKYYTKFTDLKGGEWTISIEVPGYSGTATQLTAGPDPFVTEGTGGEDQTECILGSTATLSLICLSGQSDIFEDIRPTAINNRRVTAKRKKTATSYSETIWQGMIKMEQYSQPYDGEPYDVQLPCISMLELMKEMPLPEYGTLSSTPTTTAEVLQYIVGLTGCNVEDIYSNVKFYIGKDNTADTTHDWVQSNCYLSHFYEFTATEVKPKKLSDVLDAICYPYGHARDLGTDLYIMFNGASNRALYNLEGGAMVAAGTFSPISMQNVSLLSTDNTKTHINGINSVTYRTGIDQEATIFELSNDMIKSTHVPEVKTNDYKYEGNGKTRWLELIPESHVNTESYITDFSVSGGTANPFCRVTGVEKVSGVQQYTISEEDSLSFFNQGARNDGTRVIRFKLRRKAYTEEGLNAVKITIKERTLDSQSGEPGGCNVKMFVGCDGKYLVPNNSSGLTWVWTTGTFGPTKYMFPKADSDHIKGMVGSDTSGERYVIFNEPRTSGDKTPKEIELAFAKTNSTETLFMFTLKVEYVTCPNYIYDGTKITSVNSVLAEGSTYNDTFQAGTGEGDSLTVNFKTMCGETLLGVKGGCDVPWHGFMDATNKIDTAKRTMLDISEAQIIDSTDPNDHIGLATYYSTIVDGTTTYIPQAVGINARNCTLSLKLISTNI